MANTDDVIWVNGLPVAVPAGAFPAHAEPRTLVRFAGPVLAAWRAALAEAQVRVEFWCPPYGACVRPPSGLPPEALGARFPFLVGARPYRQEHSRRAPPAAAAAAPLPADLVDVVCFGSAARPAVEAQLAALGVPVLARSSSKLRVRYGGDLAVLRDLPGVKIADAARAPVLAGPAAPGAPSALARALGAADALGAWPAAWDGRGEVVAVADTGLDRGANDATLHADFRGRVRALTSWPANPSWAPFVQPAAGDDGPADRASSHGTHVAGLALGSGAASGGRHRGVAPAAELVFQAIEQRVEPLPAYRAQVPPGYYLCGRPLDLRDLFGAARQAGARIHVNSWGDPARGAYTDDCFEADLFLREHPDAVLLFAAGNDGADRDGNRRLDERSLYAPASAKNVISVGATEGPADGVGWRATWGRLDPGAARWGAADRADGISGEPDRIAPFSGTGPTADDRRKPDVCAPGSNLAAPRSQATAATGWGMADPLPLYMYDGGTSAATGLAGGVAAVVRQAWRARRRRPPSGAGLKALLILGARPVRGRAPGTWAGATEGGFGALQVSASLPLGAGGTARLHEPRRALDTGETWELALRLTAPSSVRAVLAWYDTPGERLVNDLDLSLVPPGGPTVWGNHPPDGPGTPDRRNTVEVIARAGLPAGRYLLRVTGANVPDGPQAFALAIAVAGA